VRAIASALAVLLLLGTEATSATSPLPSVTATSGVALEAAPNVDRALTTAELLALRVELAPVRPPVTVVADATILRDTGIPGAACLPELQSLCGIGQLSATGGARPVVFAAAAVLDHYQRAGDRIEGRLAFQLERDRLEFLGRVVLPDGGPLVQPATEDTMAWAQTANAGRLVAVEGWLTALGWGIPCRAPPPKLFGEGDPADSPFVRCPGGWITPDDALPEQAPGTGALAPTGFGIPVQASACADFAPDPGAIVDYQAPPRQGVYLLRHIGIRAGRPTGWQVVGRLDPIDQVIARASEPRPPFERLWRPLDPADNPFPYACSDGRYP
jgi:hypothetical protein